MCVKRWVLRNLFIAASVQAVISRNPDLHAFVLDYFLGPKNHRWRRLEHKYNSIIIRHVGKVLGTFYCMLFCRASFASMDLINFSQANDLIRNNSHRANNDHKTGIGIIGLENY